MAPEPDGESLFPEVGMLHPANQPILLKVQMDYNDNSSDRLVSVEQGMEEAIAGLGRGQNGSLED